MDLSVIIVTYNNEKEIGRCLRSVFEHSEGLDIEVFVVDNASTDKTQEVVENTLRQAQGDNSIVIPRSETTRGLNVSNSAPRFLVQGITTSWTRNDVNLGFAAAVNQGIEQSAGDNILLLNPDTELMLGSLSTMVNYLRDHAEVGIAGGKVLNPNGGLQPSVRRFPTLKDQVAILLKLHRRFPKMISDYLCVGFDYDKEQEVDQVRGAYYYLSRDLIKKIGPLDANNFFIWFEEVDYCKRAKEAGFKVMYVPSSMARHEGAASFNHELAIKKQWWFDKSLINYFRKHGNAFDVIVLTLLAPVSLFMALIVQRLKIKPKHYA